MSLYNIILLNAVALELVKRFSQEYLYREIPNATLAAWTNDYQTIFTYECVTEAEAVNILDLDVHSITVERYEVSSKKVFLFTDQLLDAKHPLFETYHLQFECIRKWTNLKSLISTAFDEAAIFTVNNSGTLYFLLQKCLRQTTDSMVNDIVASMDKYRAFTLKDLARTDPSLIRKYMGYPNLTSVVANCLLHFVMLPPPANLTPAHMFNHFSKLLKNYPAGGNACKIVNFINFQGIDLNRFYQAIYMVFFHAYSGRKGLIISGQPNVGKTSFLFPLTLLFPSFKGLDNNLVNLRSCIGKELLFLDNFGFGANNISTLTKLAEGEFIQIRLNNGEFFDMRVNYVVGTCQGKPALNHRFHVFEFPREVSTYSSHFTPCERNQMQFCEKNQTQDPMSKHFESYWNRYEAEHSKCAMDCGHCSKRFCHLSVSGQCQNHEENIHSMYAVKKLSCKDHKGPITSVDWLEFFVHNVKDWLSSRMG